MAWLLLNPLAVRMYHLYKESNVMQKNKPSSIKGLFLPAIALCSLFVTGNVAQAALVNYSFTGGVSNISGALLSPTMNLTSHVTGSFQFNNATGGVGGNYPGAVKAMTVTIGGYSSSFTPGANAITISQNTNLGGGLLGDRWNLATAATGLPTSGYTPYSFELLLDREGGGLFSNTNLQNAPSLSSLTGTRWRLIFQDAEGNLTQVRGAINSLTAVPLPAAVFLFGAGLISLVGLGAGGLRNLRGTQQA
ncbi:conserved exported hypothetical protein [Nitrospira lenta]|uniref:Uncharacterized protein n=1 Tax=Nitrospira lenta TaxID=1436998 RepID=A0A330LBC5_9BACT|nr:conserved exported hypothetical protein [Nitrospira lenta]